MLALAASTVSAHQFETGDIKIKHPYTIETTDASADVAVYMTIVTGVQPDRLIGLRSAFAKTATIVAAPGHAGAAIDLPANTETVVGPNTAFVVLHDLTEPLAGYQYFPMTLTFERAGTVEIEVYVEDATEASPTAAKN